MDTIKKKRVVVPLGLRPELIAKLDTQAAEEGRSRHGQLVRIVEQWFLNTDRLTEAGQDSVEAKEVQPIPVISKSQDRRVRAQGGETVMKTDAVGTTGGKATVSEEVLAKPEEDTIEARLRRKFGPIDYGPHAVSPTAAKPLARHAGSPCPVCEKPLADGVNSWRCGGCGRNFPK
jgi:hypothetical protein